MAAPKWFTDTFGPGADIQVAIAWGADLTADPSTWVWTDVTDDVRQDPGIAWRKARSDEAGTTQPATFTCVLHNTSGDYATGPTSSNWPNVRRGTPVRLRINPGTADYDAFTGEAVGFTPGWDLTGTIPVVTLTAAGTLRRLGQGQSPVMSPLRRALVDDAGVVAYWPCEEGKGARFIAPAVGTYNLTFNQGIGPDFASNAKFVCTKPIPTIRNTRWRSLVAPYTNTGVIQVDFLAYFDDAADEPDGTIIRLETTDPGDTHFININFDTNTAGLDIVMTNPAGGGGFFAGGPFQGLEIEPRARKIVMQLEQNGADVDYLIGTVDPLDIWPGFAASGTATSLDLGTVTAIAVNPDGALNNVAIGHIVIRDQIAPTGDIGDELRAYAGETATERITRLCAENGERVTLAGASDITMGPQSVATLLDLLRECEAADGGTLYDGDGPGLQYRPRYLRENANPVLEISAAAGDELAAPFDPVDDDQRTRNAATVTRSGGSASTYADVTGPMGTAVIGTYDTSATLNVETDDQAAAAAEWIVHVGTVQGLRHPALTVDVRAAPDHAEAVLALVPGDRIDVDGLSTALSGYPEDTMAVGVEGIAHALSAGSWKATVACSPHSPWELAVATSETGAIEDMTAGAVETIASPTTLAPALPSGTAVAGDLILAFLTVRTGTIDKTDPDDDWFLIAAEETNAGADGSIALYGLIVAENETPTAGSWTVAGGAANGVSLAQCYRVRGTTHDPALVVQGSNTSYNASDANITVPALSAGGEGLLLQMVFGWRRDDWTSVATLAGQFFTELVDNPTTAGDDAGIEVQYRVLVPATNVAATSLVVTGGAAAVGRCIVAAFRPDPDAREFRVDTDGSTLDANVSVGATSISVASTAGPLWTTAAGDYPLDLDVDGVRYHVTACADATSPQTMTIDPAPVARSAGAAVALWRPGVPGR